MRFYGRSKKKQPQCLLSLLSTSQFRVCVYYIYLSFIPEFRSSIAWSQVNLAEMVASFTRRKNYRGLKSSAGTSVETDMKKKSLGRPSSIFLLLLFSFWKKYKWQHQILFHFTKQKTDEIWQWGFRRYLMVLLTYRKFYLVECDVWFCSNVKMTNKQHYLKTKDKIENYFTFFYLPKVVHIWEQWTHTKTWFQCRMFSNKYDFSIFIFHC